MKEQVKDQRHETQSFTDGIRDASGRLYKYTYKESAFVYHYLTDAGYCGTRAAKMAGYNCTTPGSFRNVSANLLKKDHIRAAINAAFEALTMPKHEILFRLGRIAAGDIVDVMNDDNDLDLNAARDRGTSFLIKKVEIKRARRADDDQVIDETVKFEIHDPLRALELLGKHSRLFVERVESTGKDGRPLIPENPASVIVYLPDNGRGDQDQTTRGKTERTTGKSQ